MGNTPEKNQDIVKNEEVNVLQKEQLKVFIYMDLYSLDFFKTGRNKK